MNQTCSREPALLGSKVFPARYDPKSQRTGTGCSLGSNGSSVGVLGPDYVLFGYVHPERQVYKWYLP